MFFVIVILREKLEHLCLLYIRVIILKTLIAQPGSKNTLIKSKITHKVFAELSH